MPFEAVIVIEKACSDAILGGYCYMRCVVMPFEAITVI